MSDQRPRVTSVEVAGQEIHVLNLSSEQETILRKRAAFVASYCAEKGWPTDITSLSMKQIMEIRDQPGWQNPT